MNSLRARLILGFSLVAVLPLALAMLLLGTRIQGTVQAQAAARLETAMGVVQGELASDGERLAARLTLLARDPQLKRLYLVESGNNLELRQYLADQNFLLGLDYLAITDTVGRVLADASTAPAARSRPGRDALGAEALPVARDSGLAVVALSGTRALALDARAPIPYLEQTVGFVRGGILLDSLFLARLQRSSGLDLVLRDASGRVLATTLAGGNAGVVLNAGGAAHRSDSSAVRVVFAGRSYLMRDATLGTGAGRSARLTAFASTATADDALSVLRSTALVLGLLGLLLAVVLGIVWSHQVSQPVERLADFSERISRGEWDEPLRLESVRELQNARGCARAHAQRARQLPRQAARERTPGRLRADGDARSRTRSRIRSRRSPSRSRA